MDGDRLVGFLIGETRLDAPWDRAGWVELAGHAVDPASRTWRATCLPPGQPSWCSELGVFRYLVNVPASDRDAIEAWSQLDFGQMHCGAIRSTDASDLGAVDPTIVVRAAGPGDEAIMGEASELIWREQAAPPSWSPMLPERIEPNRSDWIEELTLGDWVWIAEDAASHEPLGVSVSYPLDPDLDIPDQNIKLASTATFRRSAPRRGPGPPAPGAHRRCRPRHSVVRDRLAHLQPAGLAGVDEPWLRAHAPRMERLLDPRVAWANGNPGAA